MSRRAIAIAAALVLVTGVILHVTGLAGTVRFAVQGRLSAMTENWDPNGYRERYEQAAAQLKQALSQQTEAEQAIHDARFYRAFLGLKEVAPTFVFCEARVIALDGDRIVVDRGRVDGVCGGQAVLTAVGVYGVIGDVGLNHAEVLPLGTSGVTVSVLNARTDEVGTLSGQAVKTERDSTANAGDVWVTTGFGGRFPRGLLVGRTEAVTADADGMFTSAVLTPFAVREGRMMIVYAEN